LEACKPSYFSFCGGEEVGEFEEGSAETKDTLSRVFPPSGRHSYSGHNSTIVVVVRPSDPVDFFRKSNGTAAYGSSSLLTGSKKGKAA
jgi:hypothetical protein